jgi:hypothetical protein
MQLAIFEIFEKTSELKTVDERANFLRSHDSQTMRLIIEGIFNPNIKWLLPAGAPPYKFNDLTGQETQLFSFSRKLYLFVEGGNPNLKPVRREQLFIEMLESIHPRDAEILLAMKEKKSIYKGITKAVVKKAFPDIYLGG